MAESRVEEPPLLQPATYRGRRGVAVVGVLTVIEEEFEEVTAMLGTTHNLPDSPYYVHQFDASDSYDVVLRHLGDRGNIASGLGTSTLIEDFRPPYILLVGVAGGVRGRDKTQLGDIVVPVFIEGYEMRKLSGTHTAGVTAFSKFLDWKNLSWNGLFSRQKSTAIGKSRKRAIAYDHPGYRLVRNLAEPIGNSSDWLQNVDQTRRPDGRESQPKTIFGPLIYGEKILGDDEHEYQRTVLEEFDNAVAVDMESGGVGRAIYQARVTRHYNPVYLVVRGISDFTNESLNDDTRREWKPYAAHVAAAFASNAVEKLVEWG